MLASSPRTRPPVHQPAGPSAASRSEFRASANFRHRRVTRRDGIRPGTVPVAIAEEGGQITTLPAKFCFIGRDCHIPRSEADAYLPLDLSQAMRRVEIASPAAARLHVSRIQRGRLPPAMTFQIVIGYGPRPERCGRRPQPFGVECLAMFRPSHGRA